MQGFCTGPHGLVWRCAPRVLQLGACRKSRSLPRGRVARCPGRRSAPVLGVIASSGLGPAPTVNGRGRRGWTPSGGVIAGSTPRLSGGPYERKCWRRSRCAWSSSARGIGVWASASEAEPRRPVANPRPWPIILSAVAVVRILHSSALMCGGCASGITMQGPHASRGSRGEGGGRQSLDSGGYCRLGGLLHVLSGLGGGAEA
jgi:hypothetical protein